MKTTNQVLREAAELLGEKGWIQGRSKSEEGYCALGAIWAATEGARVVHYSAIRQFAHYLEDNNLGPYIATWNDRPERTAEDVILALKRCAEES